MSSDLGNMGENPQVNVLDEGHSGQFVGVHLYPVHVVVSDFVRSCCVFYTGSEYGDLRITR